MAEVFGGHLVAKALKREGVECTFMLCGGHITPIYLGCHEEGIRVIDVRHEQSAAFAADGWARITRKPGVALVTAGPGVTNTVTAVANAHRAEVPMVLIAGRSPRKQFEQGSLQEMDQTELLRPITKWARTVPATERIPEFVSMAFRYALSGRPGPVFLEIPIDLLLATADEPVTALPGKSRTDARIWGDPEHIHRAAKLLRNAERPVVMGGSSLWWTRASSVLHQFAETTRFPVFLNGMGRGALPPGHPYYLSYSRRHALENTDVLLTLGVPLDFRLGFGENIHPAAKWIQVESDAVEIGHNRPVEIGIVAGAEAALLQLLDELGPQEERPWMNELRQVEEKRLAAIREKCSLSFLIP